MTTARRPGATIRPATSDDVPILCKLIMELAIYERAPEDCHATPEKLHEQLFGDHPHAEAIVAEAGGEVVAYAIFFHNFSTWEAAPGLYLEDVYVRPTFRQKGIGRMLITALATIARERGCQRYEWSCLDWNKPSRDFYESLGARCMTEWVIYRTEGNALDRLAEEGRAHVEAMRAPAPGAPAPEGADLTFGPREIVTVHTDGGASPNPGVGGWAAFLRAGTRTLELKGGEIATTNNRMEMTAAIKALEAIAPGTQVKLHTDSQYLKNGITSWIKNWKRNGWKSRTGPVKNADLWKHLDALCGERRVEWLWLRGHAGHDDNERCDALCTGVIEDLMARTTERDRREALARARESGVIS